MCRQYGIAAKTTLQAATKRGWCTQESFAIYLNSILCGYLGIEVEPDVYAVAEKRIEHAKGGAPASTVPLFGGTA